VVISDGVLVGLEDTPASQAALQWAADYAEETGAELQAVHVLHWPVGLTPSSVKAGTRLHVPQHEIAEPTGVNSTRCSTT
jgi:nucleotide-binding universal stress UspA family protein